MSNGHESTHSPLSKSFSYSKLTNKKSLHEILPRYEVINLDTEYTGSIQTQDNSDKYTFSLLTGPDHDESEQSYSSYACARAISTYPHPPSKESRDGDPICDQFCLRIFKNRTIFSLADGCNWGIKPREAASRACLSFSKYVNKNHHRLTTTQDAGLVCLEALAEANNAIIRGKKDVHEGGTTTLLGGVMLQLLSPTTNTTLYTSEMNGHSKPVSLAPSQWCIVLVSVGDCKAYHFHRKTRRVTEITAGNRASSARDPGGRLGPCSESGHPDLRNLRLDFWPCDEDDLIFVVSDGVYDNLDPQQMGFEPKNIGLTEGLTWKDVDADESQVRKLHWTLRFLQEQFFCIQPLYAITAKWLCRRLLRHTQDLTQKCRDFMESHPHAAQPKNYSDFPGKMDHTTCIVFRVGFFPSPEELQPEDDSIPSPVPPPSTPGGRNFVSSVSPLFYLATNDQKKT